MIGRGVVSGALLWAIGFATGTIVVLTPGLNSLSPIPRLSLNPAITVAVVVIWSATGVRFARRILTDSTHPSADGVRLGVSWFAANVILDYLVLVEGMNNGWGFYAQAGIWIAYGLLLAVPIMVARRSSHVGASAADAAH